MDKPGSVCVAYVHQNNASASFVLSLRRMIDFDNAHDGLITNFIDTRGGTDGLAAARNRVAEAFLAGPEEWLLFLDTDMGFDPDAPYRLLAVADVEERPVVGALCFANREISDDGMGGMRAWPQSTIFDFEAGRFRARNTYPVNSLVRCKATGSAAIVIHRRVFEEIPGAWYDRMAAADGVLSEDLSFCARLGMLDIPVHVYTGVRTTHHKSIWLGEADFWQHYLPPVARERVEVIVPTRGRPQNAEGFMASLIASTGLARVSVMADLGDVDNIKAWRSVLRESDSLTVCNPMRGDAFGGRPATFAHKVNLAYRQSRGREPWMLLVGDDVRFYPGWLDHALGVARDYPAAVIGTNDLTNPRVMAGEHATHPLIRREYVEQVGASWDGPGVVCHEGYGHQFVDDEIVAAAKQRGQWRMAIGSIIEHHHPIASLAVPIDDTYRLGQSTAEADGALFEKRFMASFYPAEKLETEPAGNSSFGTLCVANGGALDEAVPDA